MTPDMLLTFLVLAGAVALFVSEKMPPEVVAMLSLAALLTLRLVSTEEALSGFSSPATVTVAAMFVLSAGLQHSGSLNRLGEAIARIRWGWLLALVMMLLTAAVSAFINNTAAVAVFLPLIIAAVFLADLARHTESRQNFLAWTTKALGYERGHPRAALNMSWWELEHGRPKQALKWLAPVAAEVRLLPELVTAATRCYERMNAPHKLLSYLYDLNQKQPSAALLLPLADQVHEQSGERAALDLLREKSGSIDGLQLIAQFLSLTDASGVPYQGVRALVEEHLPPVYRCHNCGFEGARVYWCCPTCKHWL